MNCQEYAHLYLRKIEPPTIIEIDLSIVVLDKDISELCDMMRTFTTRHKLNPQIFWKCIENVTAIRFLKKHRGNLVQAVLDMDNELKKSCSIGFLENTMLCQPMDNIFTTTIIPEFSEPSFETKCDPFNLLPQVCVQVTNNIHRMPESAYCARSMILKGDWNTTLSSFPTGLNKMNSLVSLSLEKGASCSSHEWPTGLSLLRHFRAKCEIPEDFLSHLLKLSKLETINFEFTNVRIRDLLTNAEPPLNLIDVNLSNCGINFFPSLGDCTSLLTLHLDNNNLTVIPKLPPSLTFLDIHSNPLVSLLEANLPRCLTLNIKYMDSLVLDLQLFNTFVSLPIHANVYASGCRNLPQTIQNRIPVAVILATFCKEKLCSFEHSHDSKRNKRQRQL